MGFSGVLLLMTRSLSRLPHHYFFEFWEHHLLLEMHLASNMQYALVCVCVCVRNVQIYAADHQYSQ